MRISDWSSDVCSSDLLRAILAVTGCEYILWPHRRADADMCGFMAEARGVGAELAGALHGHRFAGEGTPQQHLLVQLEQVLAVLGERSEERPVGTGCCSPCRSAGGTYH